MSSLQECTIAEPADLTSIETSEELSTPMTMGEMYPTTSSDSESIETDCDGFVELEVPLMAPEDLVSTDTTKQRMMRTKKMYKHDKYQTNTELHTVIKEKLRLKEIKVSIREAKKLKAAGKMKAKYTYFKKI